MIANRLAHVSGSTETRVWARNYELGILSALAAREKNWSDTVARLATLSPGTKPWGRLFFHNLVHERFLHGEALQALGDLKGALAWYECMGDVFFVDHLYAGPCALREGEICETLGRRDEAIQHYRYFCRLWRDCDPELRPMVQEVRERLARLDTTHD